MVEIEFGNKEISIKCINNKKIQEFLKTLNIREK